MAAVQGLYRGQATQQTLVFKASEHEEKWEGTTGSLALLPDCSRWRRSAPLFGRTKN